MSLVSTYVLGNDYFFYQDPVLEGSNWFLCFDDDDPPELVIQRVKGEYREETLDRMLKLFKDVGLKLERPRYNHTSGRCFGGGLKDIREADAWWVELVEPIPVSLIKNKGKGRRQHEIGQAVLYNFGLTAVEIERRRNALKQT